ncbi:Alkaline ceramidase 3 [Linnemannia zychae]|nr:Alkaline ceramidase 3 [Linnemannia zychae]
MAPTSVTPEFDKIGYWSPNTSSIDWCENNYTYSYYIAEFWNSISSLAIVAIAVIGHANLASYKERRMKLLMQAFGVIGIGSVLFHGTLRHKMQLLDELPMLYAATIGMFICIETRFGKQGRWLPIGLATWIIVTSVVFSTTSGTLQSLSFQLTYASMILGGVYFIYDFYSARRTIRPNPDVIRVMFLGSASMLTALTVWLIDYNLCVYINGVSPESILKWNPQFHAWWHFLATYGVYSQAVLVMYYHYDMKEMKPEIVMWKGFLPTVSLQPVANKKVD